MMKKDDEQVLQFTPLAKEWIALIEKVRTASWNLRRYRDNPQPTMRMYGKDAPVPINEPDLRAEYLNAIRELDIWVKERES